MNILDLVIVLAAVLYGIGGFRHGALVGALSLLGFFGGAAIGAQLAEPLGTGLAHGRAQVPIAIVCVLVLAMLGQLLGVWGAGHLRRRIVVGYAKKVDSAIGGVLGIFAVLLVSWMVAVPLASSPYPSLASEASHSSIVRTVNDAMPDSVRSLYSSLRGYLDRSGFPPVFGDLPYSPGVDVEAPDAQLTPAMKARIAKVRGSVLKIYGEARSCDRAIEGSGFVYAPHRVVTNAHVVAGTNKVGIEVAPGETIRATVTLFDPARDVAVLYVPDLDVPALTFSPEPGEHGDPAVVLGYPQDGPFTVRSARVGGRTTVSGANIYGGGKVTREIYAVRAIVRSGNSGGPLLAEDGTVLGVVFATALDSSDVGYALTDKEVKPDLDKARELAAPALTGKCTD
jgi:S1-C subfamily serine protease